MHRTSMIWETLSCLTLFTQNNDKGAKPIRDPKKHDCFGAHINKDKYREMT